MRLAGKVAIVTGASSGIGEAAALRLAEEGADVCVHGWKGMQRAEEVAHAIEKKGRRAIALRADVADSKSVDRMVTQAVRALGKVDILFNNAGIFKMTTAEGHTDELWEETLAINLTGHFYCARRVIPEMKKLGHGKIINNGSIFGHNGVTMALAYAVTKMGIHGLTRCLAVELAPYQINVNAVAPGNIVTPMNDVLYDYLAEQAGRPGDRKAGMKALLASYPIGRLGDVQDIAGMVAYLASEEADFITGQIFFVDGGYGVP
jgi:NAD(P)-dependent dehydrogenase (short-subunit alcohol dehydrogenase family)